MRRSLLISLALLMGWVASAEAQVRPGAFTTLQVTSTAATAATIGCAVGTTTGCTGTVVAGAAKFTAGIATDAATVPTHGIAMASGVPSSTSFVLYNDSGTLKFNGVALAAGSSLSGTLNAIPRFTASNAVGDSIMAQDAGATTITVTGTFNATTAIQLNGTSINTAGTLTNVAYEDQANYFTSTSGQRFKAGIAIDDAPASTHGIAMASGVPGSVLSNLFNNASILTWQGASATNLGFQLGSGAAGNNTAVLTFAPSNSATNWQMGVNVTANSVTWTPSTAGGGTTFTTPALTLSNAGVLTATTFSGGVSASAFTFATYLGLTDAGSNNFRWANAANGGTMSFSVYDGTAHITSIAATGAWTFPVGITAGSGAVGIVDSTGKIPAISSTYFASLSGANLTSIPNSATTATSANTVSTIVARDAGGDFAAGTITSALAGNATTATTLQNARTIGGVSFNGSANIVPGTITVADTTDTTSFVGLWESATGDLAPKTDAGLLYNASTGELRSTLLGVGAATLANGNTFHVGGTQTMGNGYYIADIAANVTGSVGGSAGVFQLAGGITEAASGTHPLLAYFQISPNFTGAGAATTAWASLDIGAVALDAGVVTGSSLRIAAPTGAGTDYAINVTSGNVYVAGTATATTFSGSGSSLTDVALLASSNTFSGANTRTTTTQSTTNGGAVSYKVVGKDSDATARTVQMGLGLFADNAFSISNGTTEWVRMAISTGAMAFYSTGSFTLGGVTLGPDGAIGAPTYSFSSDTDTGMYLSSGGDLVLVNDGTYTLGVGSGVITAATNTLFSASGTGGYQMVTWATTASAANAVVADLAVIKLSTSLRASKQDFIDISAAEARRVVMGLRGLTYRSAIAADDQTRRWAGFVAEDVEAVSPVLAAYSPKGALQGITYDRVPAYLVPMAQDHEARIAALEAELAALKAEKVVVH